MLIDEYDNFANTVLAYRGAEAYHSFTHGGGFYRSFFATLKGGADRSGGGLERLFITGVSPITMDDVASGFNIGTNISLEPDFNEMVGFTAAEVRHLVETYRELACSTRTWPILVSRKPAQMRSLSGLVVRDSEIMSGTPVFAGTRVPVQSLWDHLEAGDSLDKFLDSFPSVSRRQAKEVLELAGELIIDCARSAR